MACEKGSGSLESRLERAVAVLAGGGCVVYPTETFYALGAVVGSAKALERVNAIKGRPRSKPLPVIVGEPRQLGMVMPEGVTGWEGYGTARELMDRFWPGPLSVIVPAREDLPPQIKDSRGFVSVRLSPHPMARELCLRVGSPLAATSANVSGEPAVSDLDFLSAAVCLGADYVLAGEPAPAGGMPSTVVLPLAGREAVLYRAGAVAVEVIEAAGFILRPAT
jgi:L-threonylcarbamoyladenylate synthase